MEEYQKAFQEIATAVEGLQALKKTAYQQYSVLVDAVVNNCLTDQQEIERIMDGLADFGDDLEFLELYRKLCRHVYYTYPEMVGEHVSLFRALFMSNEDSEEEENA